MITCSEYEAIFWSDIHGELDHADRDVWENHLHNCTACRAEKAMTIRMMTQIQTAMAPPALSETAVRSAATRIGNRWEGRNTPASKPRRLRLLLIRLVPAAALCALLLFIAIHHFSPDTGSDSPGSPSLIASPSALSKEDEDVIENIDLLSNFETIEEIVKVVDPEENDSAPKDELQESPQDPAENAHG